MRTPLARTLLVVLVFAAALAGGLLLLRNGDEPSTGSTPGPDKTPVEQASSDLWAVGDEWTVKVKQDAGAIAPDGEPNIALVPFRFEVTEAPAAGDAKGMWLVHVSQDGAQGPSANGWNLQYADEGGTMVLKFVSVGSEPPLEAELASIVLGAQFPYEVRYTAAPKDKTIDGNALLDRSKLPPSALPGDSGEAPNATPPSAVEGGPGGVPSTPAG